MRPPRGFCSWVVVTRTSLLRGNPVARDLPHRPFGQPGRAVFRAEPPASVCRTKPDITDTGRAIGGAAGGWPGDETQGSRSAAGTQPGGACRPPGRKRDRMVRIAGEYDP